MAQPATPPRRNVGPKLQKELFRISVELDRVLFSKAGLAADEKVLKDRIREIASSYDLPFPKGASQYLNVPEIGKALRITRPEATPKIDPEAFLAAVGPELFHQLVTVVKVELRLPEWLQAVEDERVTEAALLDSLQEQDQGANDPITIALVTSFDPKKADVRG
jgi:hypothetical protein